MHALKRWESILLLIIGIAAMTASMGALYVARQDHSAVAVADDDEVGARFPLPAGPRKYQ